MGHLQVVAGVAALLFAGAASAISGNSIVTPFGPAVVHTTANSATVVYGGTASNSLSLARAYGLEAGGVAVTDSVALRTGASALVGTAARTASLAEIALGGARLLANPYIGVPLAVGSVMWTIYDRARVRADPSGRGGIQVNKDLTQRGDEYWVYPPSGDVKYQSPEVLCGIVLPAYAGNPNGPYTCTRESSDANNATFAIRDRDGNLATYVGMYRVVESWCFTEDGIGVVKPTGGLCPADGVWEPISVPDAAKRIQAKIGGNAVDALRDITDARGDVLAGPTSLTGPAHGTPQTITSNGPNGTTTTTINNNYNYTDNSVSWTGTTTTTNPDGTTTTTNDDKPADDRSNCERDQNTVGCMPPGTPPSDAPQWSTKTVTYEVDSLGLPSACPAPRSAVVHGWELKLDYTPACQVAPTISLGMLALTGLGCLLFIVRTVKA